MLEKLKRKKQEADLVADCFAPTYGVEIFVEEKPSISIEKLLRKLKSRCGNVEKATEKENLILFMFNDFMVKYSDGQLPAQIAIMITDKKVEMEKLEMSFYQTWRWKDARGAVDKTAYSILVTDMMSSSLDYQLRLALFQKTLYSILEDIPSLAINWHLTQQIVDPKYYLDNKPESDNYDLLTGALNVRLFNVEGRNDEIIMDTLGLGALGLPDLQCHFKNLDVNDIANMLYTYGDYIFNNGDVIKDGETIQGPSANDKWKCHHSISMVEPKRVVIDIMPEEKYAPDGKY